MSRVKDWWTGLSRAYQNAIALLAFNILVLVGTLLGSSIFSALWSALTSYLPNIYESIFLQLVAIIRGASPGSMVASGIFISYSSTFLSLLSVHLVVGFGIGFLFDKAPRTLVFAFIDFFTLILILFVLHLVLLLFPALSL